MSTFNAQNAVVFGLTAQQFFNIFENQTKDTPGVMSLSNSFSTVYSFTPASQTTANATSIENLFPQINNGSNTYFNLNPESYSPPGMTYNGYPVTYQYPANSSYLGVFSNTGSVQISAPSNATADLSTSTQTGNSQVAEGGLEFAFNPGSTQTLALSYQVGTSISNAVANGIANTTITGTTTTIQTGVTVTGTFPGGSAAVNTSASEAWLQQQQQQISYTDTQTDTVNTNVTTTTTINPNSVTPNSSGQYIWTNPDGQTITLIPNQLYIAEVIINQSEYGTPVSNSFQITGPNMTLPMKLAVNIVESVLNYPLPPEYGTNTTNPSLPVTENVSSSINTANLYGYSLYSGIDNSLFTYSTSPTAIATYSGLVSSTTTTGTLTSTEILPYSTTSDATVAPTQLANGLKSLSIDTVAANTTVLDLKAAAAKLSSNSGVFYDNTKTEASIQSSGVTLNGGNHDHVNLGNLNYRITNFSNSIITTGSGYNNVKIAETENNNTINFGNGNNKVGLNGNGNNLHLGNGANYIEIDGSTGKNYLIAGNGPEVIKINSGSGFTQISNWDNTQDYLHFGDSIKLSDVRVKFDNHNWSYNVYVADKLVANLITTGGLTYADSNSIVYPSAYSAPLPYNIKSNAGFVNGLYADVFNTPPDAAGLTFWTNQLNSGVSRSTVIADFMTSPQFNAEHPTNSQYVDAVYQDLLGRSADTAGLNFWTNQLNNGVSKVALVGAVLNSAEFNHLVSNN